MKKKFLAGVTILILLFGIVGFANADGTYLVYASGGSQYVLEGAMASLGFSYDVRDASNPVTASDLSSGDYEALVIGWSAGSYDMSGLDSAILTAGITGNKILTGHDADYHTYYGNAAAATFMERAVLFSGAADETGILAFPVYASDPFSYLPASWGLSAFDSFSSENITAITSAGDYSGLYAGLTTAELSNWGQSFHAAFSETGSFDVFELGYGTAADQIVTIGTTVTPVIIDRVPEPATFLLLGTGLFGLMGLRRKLNK
ncbi:MAG: PEP-CTERM sorting domain-containing protein [Pseudomonadota bacterium]